MQVSQHSAQDNRNEAASAKVDIATSLLDSGIPDRAYAMDVPRNWTVYFVFSVGGCSCNLEKLIMHSVKINIICEKKKA